ncbi:MAG: hypothetical protein JNM25_15705 [Planctomycetes bacterium]|nr:hypothetical protein [Planctomycetota bacterium]
MTMPTRPVVRARFPACIPLLLTLMACSVAQEPLPPEQAARLGRMHDAGIAVPLTLYPLRVLGRPDTRSAQALGLVLEHQGMSTLEVAASAFPVDADLPWAEVPARFGAFVRQQATGGVASGLHLYGEFLGTPREGPQEVRFVVVDGHGDLVVADRQTPNDRAFRRTAGRDPDPMGCATLVADRLFTLAAWRRQPQAVRDGKFARLWRELSGAPDPGEVAAMAPRLAALREATKTARFVVLPTIVPTSVVPTGHDAAGAGRLAEALSRRLGCRARPAVGGGDIEVTPDSNEQKRLWDLARGLRAAAATQAADADYLLIADLGIGGEGRVAYVHFVVCTAAGDYVIVDWQNDQNELLRRAAPRSVEAAERYLIDRLARLLG